MATLIQIRRDTQANWTSNNPILASGEIAFSTDQYKIKIGNGSSNWSSLSYMTATPTEITAQIDAAVSGIVDSAPGVLDTLNEIAAAINDDPNFFTTIATNLSNHEADTTNIHGIADTSLLATTSYVDTAESDAITSSNSYSDSLATNYDSAGSASAVASDLTDHENATTSVHGIADTSLLATTSYVDTAESDAVTTANSYSDGLASNYDASGSASAVASDLTDHENATTSVHGISNTANLVYTDDSRLSDSRTPTSHAGSHASGGTDEITVAQSQVTNLTTDLGEKAPLASPSLTGTPTAPTATAGTNNTQVATTAYADASAASAASALVDAAPATLDTLNELAAALGDDPNFATTVSTSLGNKQPLDADLTAIAGLTGTSGLLKKTAADTWALDTNTYLTGNQTVTLTGDVSGSGTTSISVTVADDSHNHIISNVDGLQTALNEKSPLASPTFTGPVTLNSKINIDTSTVTVSATSATTVNALSSEAYRSAEYLVQVTQGSKQTISKVIMIHDGTTANISEYAVIELGGTRIPLTLSTTMSGTDVLLQATITDADVTNATIEVFKTAIVL